MRTFRFLDFTVYKEARVFYQEIVLLTRSFPREYWELGDQIRRAALSVCLNIAEGSAKRSDKDFNRFIENSLGSINEVAAGLDIGLFVGLINEKLCSEQVIYAEKIAKQLGAFSKKLKQI